MHLITALAVMQAYMRIFYIRKLCLGSYLLRYVWDEYRSLNQKGRSPSYHADNLVQPKYHADVDDVTDVQGRPNIGIVAVKYVVSHLRFCSLGGTTSGKYTAFSNF